MNRSSLDFETLFKISDANTRQSANKKLKIPKWRLQFARFRFSFRTRLYWNFLPVKIREMTAGSFKIEAKKHICENKQEYLNFGLKFNIVDTDEDEEKKL